MLELMLGTGVIETGPPPDTFVNGQAAFTSAQVTNWIVPDGVNSISAVCVGGGARGQVAIGGSLRWIRRIGVTPGETLIVTVGRGGAYNGIAAAATSIKRGATVLLSAAGGDGGLSTAISLPDIGGGDGGARASGYSGGAGGYSGNGGPGGQDAPPGGGGGGGRFYTFNGKAFGSAGGGVGLLGEGASGTAAPSNSQTGGIGGSGGDGGQSTSGGNYGGGGGSWGIAGGDGDGGTGGCRIIWGAGRRYPKNLTANMS